VIQTLEEWQAEMKERFPGGSSTVAFICPVCKNVATIDDFLAAGLTANDAPQQCLFRATDRKRCDWVAYGLFQAERKVKMPDGTLTPVFKFAPATQENNAEDNHRPSA
jgi:hypothetical protein